MNYYYQFIKDFVAIARPLHDIVRKNWEWEWTEKQEILFRELKKHFTKESVLVALDLDKKMRMEVDILDFATEGGLSIGCEDGKWWPVAFLSKSLNKTENIRFMIRRY